jgi:hypothetical protein
MKTETSDRTLGEGQDLFDRKPAAALEGDKPADVGSMATARVILPHLTQVELRPMDLESLLLEDHRARLVWAWVERQKLNGMHAVIKVRQGGVGRSAIAPEILLGLWLQATPQGVGGARQLSRQVLEHDGYRWMSGGVQVAHHSLSVFRVAHAVVPDEVLGASLTALMSSGAVTLQCVAQDDVRVRARAAAAPLRRKASQHDNPEPARARVRELKEQIDADPAQDSRSRAMAQQRARREMQQRLQSVLDRLTELEAIRRRSGGKAEEARASSTDADAGVTKMADGGYRPAYKTQYASGCDSQGIVGVEVSTSGSDMAQLTPVAEQIEQRLRSAPSKMLVDGGCPAHTQIDAVADKTEVYALVREARVNKDEQGQEVRQGKLELEPDDSAAVVSWRQRMASDEAQDLYKRRAATADCVNAQARNRSLQRMPVQGLQMVRCVSVLLALAHNLMRTLAPAPQLLGLGTTASAAGAVHV